MKTQRNSYTHAAEITIPCEADLKPRLARAVREKFGAGADLNDVVKNNPGKFRRGGG